MERRVSARLLVDAHSLARRREANRWISAAFHFLPVVVFVILPILIFLVHSLWSVDNGQIVYHLTLENYRRFLTDGVSLPIFFKTLALGLGVTAITLLVSYPTALLIWALRPFAKYLMLVLFVIPLFMSYIIKIYAIRGILGRNGALNDILLFLGILDTPSSAFLFNMTAVLITLSLLLLPFALLPAFIALERIPRELIEASTDLGAGSWHTFSLIVLPLSLPGTIVGASFCFVLAIGDFVTPEMVGGKTGFTLGRLIFSQFGMAYNWPFGSALSVVLLVVAVSTIALASRLTRTASGEL